MRTLKTLLVAVATMIAAASPIPCDAAFIPNDYVLGSWGATIVKHDRNVFNQETFAVAPVGYTFGPIAFAPDGNLYASLGGADDQIAIFSSDGAQLGAFSTATQFTKSRFVFDPDGNLYVGIAGNGVKKFSPSGVDLGVLPLTAHLHAISDMTLIGNDEFLVSDLNTNGVYRFKFDGTHLGQFVSTFRFEYIVSLGVTDDGRVLVGHRGVPRGPFGIDRTNGIDVFSRNGTHLETIITGHNEMLTLGPDKHFYRGYDMDHFIEEFPLGITQKVYEIPSQHLRGYAPGPLVRDDPPSPGSPTPEPASVALAIAAIGLTSAGVRLRRRLKVYSQARQVREL